MNANIEPKLEAPGKGLPLLEKLVAKYWVVPRQAKKTTWDESAKRFKRESEKILELTRPLSADVLNRRVLIARITGIEDSSRYWSPAMCLEHLMITAPNMAMLVTQLSHGRVPAVTVDIAKVKPGAAARMDDARDAFAEMVARVTEQLRVGLSDRASRAKFAHPWFGPMTAHEWHWLMGSHQWIHRKQIEMILKLGG